MATNFRGLILITRTAHTQCVVLVVGSSRS